MFFLKKHKQNMVEKVLADPFQKKLNTPLHQQPGLLYSSVCLRIQVEERQNILKVHLF